uniref:Uncharacterized protein n=2 Tax=Arion vulgaris TaxID=1028688 RepID=A0A0B6ZPU9_9EUPU
MFAIHFITISLVAAIILLPGPSTQSERFNVSEATQNTTNLVTVPSYSTVIKTDLIATCTKYAIQSTEKPVHLKAEPLCTESGSSLDQLIRFIGNHFKSQECGNSNIIAYYTEILYCSILNAHTICLQPYAEALKNTNTETVPTMSKVRQIIEDLCNMKHMLEEDCMFRRLKYVSRCVQIEVESVLVMQSRKWTYGTIDACRHLEIKVLCMWEGLQPCNRETAGLMVGLISKHLRSETCTFSRSHMVQPLTWICLATAFVILHF